MKSSYRATATAPKRPAATKAAATMPVSRGCPFAPAVLAVLAVLAGWTCDDEAEAEDVPFAVVVVVGVATPAVEVEQTGLATRFVRLGQAARAELSCEMWAL
jgi:hypothetical protein